MRWLLLLIACHHPARVIPPADGLVLGWRLAPGMHLCYQLSTSLATGPDTVMRRETWAYLVRRVEEPGVFTIEGRMVDLQTAMSRDGLPLAVDLMATVTEEERARLAAEPVSLTMAMDGRLDRVEGPSWSDTLPHRLMGMVLPTDPIGIGSAWPDTAMARPYAELVPPSVELQLGGRHRLEDVSWQGAGWPVARSGFPAAHISTEALVLPEDGRLPAMDITGDAMWNMALGRLHSRTISVSERGGTGPGSAGLFQAAMLSVDCPAEKTDYWPFRSS